MTQVDAGLPPVADQLYPEWGNVRFSADGFMTAGSPFPPLEPCNPVSAIGPTSRSTRFTLAPGQYWTVSLTPLGWTRFLAVPASSMADRWEIVAPGSAFGRFATILDCVRGGGDADGTVSAIDTILVALLDPPKRGEDAIEAMHAALLEPSVQTVGEMASRVGIGMRQLERLAVAAFGFTPKLLLRRQRFLRSLSLFMRDPSLAWIDTLDSQYTDQAHFIRDFRRFMDTTPGAFAAEPHPVLWAAVAARIAAAGTAMQVLQPGHSRPGIAIARARP